MQVWVDLWLYNFTSALKFITSLICIHHVDWFSSSTNWLQLFHLARDKKKVSSTCKSPLASLDKEFFFQWSSSKDYMMPMWFLIMAHQHSITVFLVMRLSMKQSMIIVADIFMFYFCRIAQDRIQAPKLVGHRCLMSLFHLCYIGTS